MKKKVESGEDYDEASIKVPATIAGKACTPLSTFTDVGFQTQRHRLVKQGTNQPDVESCAAASNCLIRLKIPLVTTVGEVDAEEDESELHCGGTRSATLANNDKNQEFTSMEATCEVEGSTSNLTHMNGYLRRNKVCQNHFNAFKVEVGDSELRFCQQCSRFHMLAEFDEDKRRCRATLVGHNNMWKTAQPEPTSVLQTGTLVCLPGKSIPGSSTVSEDLERTITNEEMSESDNNLRDDASSEPVYRRKNYCCLESANPIPSQMTYMERMDKARSEDIALAHPTKEAAGTLNATSTSASKLGRPKNDRSRKRIVSQLGHSNMCQVEGCMFDLSNTRDYFKRRKVCENHFKALVVKVQNVDHRFCQQCSRFHVLAEFDQGRKSCKRMLMGHNMRRRKGKSKAVCREVIGARKEINSVKVCHSRTEIQNASVNLGLDSCRRRHQY